MTLWLLYELPIWLVGLVLLIVLVTVLEVGYRIGFRQRERWKDAESGGGTVVLSSMFALLGLILAFTYASGVSRYESRKQAIISEANALSTAFLRAELIAEPNSAELRQALLAYAKTRVMPRGAVIDDAQRLELLDRTLQAQARLWPVLEEGLRQEKPGPIEASLVAAMNDVLDAHTIRLAAIFDKLPLFVTWVLVFISAATLAVAGFNAGISGRISRWRTTALAMVMTGVMLLILDFDRPVDGHIRVTQRSMIAAVAEMEADLAR